MKNIPKVFFLLAVFTYSVASGQNAMIAKLKYEAAEEHFSNAQYKDCLASLEEAAKALGKVNPPIEYLRIKAYEKEHETLLSASGPLYKDNKFEHVVYLHTATNAFLKSYGNHESLEEKVREVLKVQGKYGKLFALLEGALHKEMMGWLLSAQKGNVKAIMEYATFLQENDFSREAFPWFIRAAEKGNVDAMAETFRRWYSLEYMSEYVEGYEKSEVRNKVVSFIKKSVAEQHPMALLNYGRILVEGDEKLLDFLGMSKDVEKGLEMMKKSAALGYKDAFRRLGDVYRFGEGGVTKNYATALDFYLQGDYKTGIAIIYADGGDGVQQDMKKALTYIKNEPHDMWVYSMVGDWYREGGAGLEKDYAMALGYYERAIEQAGKSNDKYDHGFKDVFLLQKARLLLEGGNGIQRDYQTSFDIAFALYEKETTDKDEKNEAAFIIGEITFAKLTKHADQFSKAEIASLSVSMTRCFEDAVNVEDSSDRHTAMERLAEIYEKGIGVQKNKKLAAEWKKKAEAAKK